MSTQPLAITKQQWAQLTTPPPARFRVGDRVRTVGGTTGQIVGFVCDWPNVAWDQGASNIAGRTLCIAPSLVQLC